MSQNTEIKWSELFPKTVPPAPSPQLASLENADISSSDDDLNHTLVPSNVQLIPTTTTTSTVRDHPVVVQTQLQTEVHPDTGSAPPPPPYQRVVQIENVTRPQALGEIPLDQIPDDIIQLPPLQPQPLPRPTQAQTRDEIRATLNTNLRELRNFNRFVLNYQYYSQSGDRHIFISGVDRNTWVTVLKVPVHSANHRCGNPGNEDNPVKVQDFTTREPLIDIYRQSTHENYRVSYNNDISRIKLGTVSGQFCWNFDLIYKIQMSDAFSYTKFTLVPQGTCMRMKCTPFACCFMKQYLLFDEEGHELGSVTFGDGIDLRLEGFGNIQSYNSSKAILISAALIIGETYFAPRCFGFINVGEKGFDCLRWLISILVFAFVILLIIYYPEISSL